jgi:hypothetical protein
MVNLHSLHTLLLGIKTPWPCVAKREGCTHKVEV